MQASNCWVLGADLGSSGVAGNRRVLYCSFRITTLIAPPGDGESYQKFGSALLTEASFLGCAQYFLSKWSHPFSQAAEQAKWWGALQPWQVSLEKRLYFISASNALCQHAWSLSSPGFRHQCTFSTCFYFSDLLSWSSA